MKQISDKEYDAHLEKEHSLSTFSEYLKEIVYGGVDGIVTTFAVVAGFAGAQGNPETALGISSVAVLLFGFANLFCDATSMGLGNVLSMKADQDVYRRERRREMREIRKNAAFEKAETMHILQARGFSKKDAQTLTSVYAKNPQYWADFMMNHELEMANPEHDNPWLTGLATFVAFVIFGGIPLLPFVLFSGHDYIFLIALISTFFALVLLGVLRWRTTRENVWRSIGEIVLLGGVSAAVAYFVGTLFRG